MNTFAKVLKKVPATARTFDNGDVSIKSDEYVKGQPMFGYYRKTKAGFTLEKTCFTGRSAASYNWAKVNNPNFVASAKFEKKKAEKESTEKESKSAEFKKKVTKAAVKPKAKAKAPTKAELIVKLAEMEAALSKHTA